MYEFVMSFPAEEAFYISIYSYGKIQAKYHIE